MRQVPEVALPIVLDRAAGGSLPNQIAESIRHLTASGVLRAGEPVPSSRALARHLGVSRGTVIVAYDQLLAEGWLVAIAGSATTINPQLPRAWAAPPAVGARGASRPQEAPRIDLRPGRPLQDEVAGPSWRAAWRVAAAAPVGVSVPPLGWPGLRAAVVEHLRRLRGFNCEPDRVAVTAGGREGLVLLLHASGAKDVGVEDPGFPSLRRVLHRRNAIIRSLPTDDQGLVTTKLPEIEPPEAVIVTPAHQYPFGGTLHIDRRLALLEWARRHGVLVIEDDYDSELRYVSEPLPALASLDANQVALLGTFSKTLTPALATGFLVLPRHLVAAVEAVRGDLGQPVSLVTQRAVAEYLASGGLARHTQRMRRVYRRRRNQVVAALAGLTGVRVSPMDGGLHAVVQFDRDEWSVIDALRMQGLAVASLGEYWASEPPGSQRGFVFGFGGVSDADLAEGLATIRATLGGRPSIIGRPASPHRAPGAAPDRPS